MINKTISQFQADDYLLVLDEVVKFIQQFNCVDAIYKIGGFNAPGISDIDLIFVLDDENAWEFTRVWFLYLNNQSKNSRYLFTHYPYLISKSQFRDYNWLSVFPIFNIEKLYSKSACETNIQLGHFPYSGFLDSNLTYWLQEFDKTVPSNERQGLLRLHSMNYPIQLAEKIIGKKTCDASEFLDQVSWLRGNFYNLSSDKIKNDISNLYKLAHKLSLELNTNVANHLRLNLNDRCFDFKVSLITKTLCISNHDNNLSNVRSELLIPLIMYSTGEQTLTRHYLRKLDLQNSENFIRFGHGATYDQIMDEYTIKKDFYTIYIKWLVSNRLGLGTVQLMTKLWMNIL